MGKGHGGGSRKRARYDSGLQLDRRLRVEDLDDSLANAVDVMIKAETDVKNFHAFDRGQQERGKD